MLRSLSRQQPRIPSKTRKAASSASARRHPLLGYEPLECRLMLAADVVGALYHDVDGNGVRDQGDDGLANWTVFLDLNQDGVLDTGEPSELTDADGAFFFGGVTPGNYRVAELVRTGWTPTNPALGFVDVTAFDNESARADFLNQGSGGTGVITGNVWRDLNNDGNQDLGDTGVAGWKVFLDLNNDGLLDLEEPFELTDGSGDYTFTGVLGGGVGDAIDYEVQQVRTPGWEPAPGFDENQTAAVYEGQTTLMPDFANSPVEISGIEGNVWNDINANGLRDGGEPGLSGWTVFLDLNTNNTFDTGEPVDTTDALGDYSLLGIEPGTHRVVEVQQINFRPTSPSTGFQTVIAPNDGTRSNVDFGNQERTDAAIGGVIFVDRDHDGVRDPGEEGLPGITVYLDDNRNGVLDSGEKSVVTSEDYFYTPEVDEAGTYRFDHLAGGTYYVRQIVPVELSSTPEIEIEHEVTVSPADDRSDIDSADRYRPSEIHGFKFEDINGNHVRDAGEPGIEGVTIFIDLNRNNVYDGAPELSTTTAADGSYSFIGLEADAYVVREIVPEGFVLTFPTSKDGVLWPEGISNPSVGDVSTLLIEASLQLGESFTETVSLTLPTTGALTNLVDVFLLFDDTGSFTFNSPIVRAAFPAIIAQLQTQLPGIDLGFGVGRLEEYGSFAAEHSTGRPFILNQPIIASDVTDFSASIQSALDHEAPGYGGDQPETVVEALYQMVTGAGFDGNNNGSVLDSGAAGLLSTQINPGNSGDVPSFASFTTDASGGAISASGSVGGAGFRSGALPIIITATDTGFAYQPKGGSTVTGIDGLTLPVSQVTYNGRGTTPFAAVAGVQETVTGLNALGALVIGLGTNDSAAVDPRIGLEALANLTGAINRTTTEIANGTTDPIAPGDPFYFKIGTGGDPLVLNVADGIVAAIEGAVTSVNVNVTLRASDPRVHISFTPGVINDLGAGDTATFDVTFTGDGRPHRFDLQFVREGTDVVLGSIPVVLGTPISGEGYGFEDCHDGEHCEGSDFGNHRIGAPVETLINGGSNNRSGLGTISIEFNTPETISSANALRLFNHSTAELIDMSAAVVTGNGTDQLTWDLTSITFPDGHYTAELMNSDFLDASGLPMGSSFAFELHLLSGDVDGDALVNFNDYFEVSANFNQSVPAFGSGDADGDGLVNFNDYFDVSGNFNANLGAGLEFDFGDAPDSTTFPTLLSPNDGARHVLTGNATWLGILRDPESNGQPTANATGDGADEDGIAVGNLTIGSSVSVTVTANVPSTAFLNAWLDFNQDGDWDDAGEQVFADQVLSNGANGLSIDVPVSASVGSSLARFRITESAGYAYFGLAPNGEVEDYQINVVASEGFSSSGKMLVDGTKPRLGSINPADELLGTTWTRVFVTKPDLKTTFEWLDDENKQQEQRNQLKLAELVQMTQPTVVGVDAAVKLVETPQKDRRIALSASLVTERRAIDNAFAADDFDDDWMPVENAS